MAAAAAAAAAACTPPQPCRAAGSAPRGPWQALAGALRLRPSPFPRSSHVPPPCCRRRRRRRLPPDADPMAKWLLRRRVAPRSFVEVLHDMSTVSLKGMPRPPSIKEGEVGRRWSRLRRGPRRRGRTRRPPRRTATPEARLLLLLLLPKLGSCQRRRRRTRRSTAPRRAAARPRARAAAAARAAAPRLAAQGTSLSGSPMHHAPLCKGRSRMRH